jgi:hypothetical protein
MDDVLEQIHQVDLELWLIKPSLKDHAGVHPCAGNGCSWREAAVRKSSKSGVRRKADFVLSSKVA